MSESKGEWERGREGKMEEGREETERAREKHDIYIYIYITPGREGTGAEGETGE